MFAWSFSARTIEEVASLLRAMSRHRYLREAEFSVHWTVDEALADDPRFAEHAARFRERRSQEADLDVTSRDPTLFRKVSLDDIIATLGLFWNPEPPAARASERLRRTLESSEMALATHEPFQADPEDPPHPELILLDWELFPIDELDSERHAGALRALELMGEEVNVSAPVYQEAVTLAYPELSSGSPRGVLPTDFLIWSDGDYSYVDYVLRGVAKAAKLLDPPLGYRDFD